MSTFVNGSNMQKSKLLLWIKTKNKFWGENRENKIYNISETELEANRLQNTRILETWKLLTKSKVQYIPKILVAEKTIKRHKPQGERDNAS